jgi:hypothetical protein
MRTRKYRDQFNVKASFEKGGGKVIVEQRVSRTIESMYARMLATGELQKAQMVASANHGSKDRAVELMMNAAVAPQYMPDGEKYEVVNKMASLDKKIKKAKDKIDFDNKINKIVDEKIEERYNTTV